MSALKVHLMSWRIPPTESDPDGDPVLACGRDGERLTTNLAKVTCALCLRAATQQEKSK